MPDRNLRPLTDAFLHDLIEQAEQSPRGRVNYNLHAHDEPVQRMINVVTPGSYITPHKHENPDKVELICPLIGRIVMFQFDDVGEVTGLHVVDANGPTRLIDIPPRTYHTFFALTPTAVLEIIQGPYDAKTHKKFAPWAPLEGDAAAGAYMERLLALVDTTAR
ncbi:MAG: WbuC family cupin fold metalloprotein [Anaerolineae bacterium]|nr:WbuC family cupin fold metalloprotein [Anaerolineae bacterium]